MNQKGFMMKGKLRFTILTIFLVILVGCVTYRTKQFIAKGQSCPVIERWDISPELYAFVGTSRYSKKEAESRTDFFLSFLCALENTKIKTITDQGIEVLIDSIFVRFPREGKWLPVYEQEGKELFEVSSSSMAELGKIIIPNDVISVELGFNFKQVNRVNGSLLFSEHCTVQLKRKESSYPFIPMK